MSLESGFPFLDPKRKGSDLFATRQIFAAARLYRARGVRKKDDFDEH